MPNLATRRLVGQTADQAGVELLTRDVRAIFGPANTATHVLATEGDLGQPHEVIRVADQLADIAAGLPPTRLGPRCGGC